MAYCTQEDVQQANGGLARLVQLTDWNRLGVPGVDEIVGAIAEADDLINSFASKVASVPYSPVPGIIRRTSASLAKLILVRNRGQLTDRLQLEWDRIAGTDKSCPGWLYLLATGVVTVGTDPLPPPHGSLAVDGVDTQLPPDRDVAREKLVGFW
jgi:phage gp36-like protein